MTASVFIAMAAAFALAMVLTGVVRSVGLRRGHLDGPGVAGQVKARTRRVPNTGGIAIFWSIVLPVLGVLAAVHAAPSLLSDLVPSAAPFMDGIRDQTQPALVFLGCLLALHVVGLVDDRKPLGPGLKLAVMMTCAAGVVLGTQSRLLTFLDSAAGGSWLSVLITILWMVIVTNAMNFIDNMDGLSAGVASIAGGCFLWAALAHPQPQWFIASCLALLIGACLGFLVFNFPRKATGGASIFMGDGGSLVLGFALAFLTVRTTYYDPHSAGGWYAVLMPLVVLAVPLYDFASVCVIRVRAGRSPFVGDLNHLSHRLVRRGLCRRDAVIMIYGLTGITALGSIGLPLMPPWRAILAGVQTGLVLLVLALYEGRVQEPAAGGDLHSGAAPP